jgi:DNA-binding NarL/FixJ family response regulator
VRHVKPAAHLIPKLDPRAEPAEIRLLVVDDEPLFRVSIRSLLEREGVTIIGEAGTGEEAVSRVQQLSPDVVLMDLHMPGIGGVEATRKIAACAPLVQVVILSVSDQECDVVDAVLAGACGYVLKDAPLDQFLFCIRSAAAGESFISPRVAGHVLTRVRSGKSPTSAVSELGLSRRELQILRLIASGKSNPEIAAVLGLSVKTVKKCITSLLRKLQMRNRIEAAIYAIRRGIV